MKAKIKKPKYKLEDLVYSYQNPNVKRKVNRINESTEVGFQHKYRLTLIDKDGYNVNSNWISENSLYKTKKKK